MALEEFRNKGGPFFLFLIRGPGENDAGDLPPAAGVLLASLPLKFVLSSILGRYEGN